MRSFESQGLIRRRQGIGTFVVGRTQVIESGLEVLESIETLADRILLEVSMEDLKIEPIKAMRRSGGGFRNRGGGSPTARLAHHQGR